MKYLLLLALAACTPAAQQTAVTGIDAGCVAITSIDAPAATPLCAPGAALVQEVFTWIDAHNGAKPAITTSAAGALVVPADLFSRLAGRPEVRLAKAAKPCAAGSVAP